MKKISSVFAAIASILTLSSFGLFAQSSKKPHSIDVPFDFFHNEIILSININGKGPFNMLLDTDTDPSAVDLVTAKEIGLKLDSHASLAAGGGTSKNVAYGTKLALITAGILEAKNIEAGAIDLSTVSTNLGKKIHGVLGYSFLKNRIVQIDYPAKVVRF